MSREILVDKDDDNIILIPLLNRYKKLIGYAKADIDDYDKLKDLKFYKYASKL